jgi:hypothetical protein
MRCQGAELINRELAVGRRARGRAPKAEAEALASARGAHSAPPRF